MAEKSFEKLIGIIDQMSVLELAEAVKALKDHFGVADMVVASSAAPAAGSAPVAAEKSEYKVVLVEGGAETIKVIKALRQIVPTLALADAKAAVVGGDFVVAEAAPKAEAEKMKAELEAAGAKVKLA